jgi:anhydro-N-acetylmuramic acid kinase
MHAQSGEGLWPAKGFGMREDRVYTALGLMSGTSADGIDAAIVRTDGRGRIETGPARAQGYDPALRRSLREAMTLAQSWAEGPMPEPLCRAAAAVTQAHAEAVRALLAEAGVAPGQVDLIGFHGQTVLHRPGASRTVQLGDGALLAAETGIDVVCDFRSADVAAGGQGAPFVPLYHRARADGLGRPLAILNIGGVSNITYIGETLLAFDAGPGNGPLDDWAMTHLGLPMDEDGRLAARGCVDDKVLAQLLTSPYFARRPPKSLDRLEFDLSSVRSLSAADGAATLAAFTVEAVRAGLVHLPGRPARWLVAGGGRRNPVLMDGLARALGQPVEPVEAVGWRGDMLEAEAFAYLAVRSLKGLPLTEPGTTGVRQPMTGGRICRAS